LSAIARMNHLVKRKTGIFPAELLILII